MAIAKHSAQALAKSLGTRLHHGHSLFSQQYAWHALFFFATAAKNCEGRLYGCKVIAPPRSDRHTCVLG